MAVGGKLKPLVVPIAVILALSAGDGKSMKLSGAPAVSAVALAPIVGVGDEPCASWTEHRQAKDQDASVAAQWLLGYLSGYDQFRVTRNKHLWFRYDVEPVLGFIDRRCAEEPDSTPVLILNRLMYRQEGGAAFRLRHPSLWPTRR